jgi:hypothetical protein
MTRYCLSGYMAIGYKAPTFLIPYFSRRDTNEVFVQELDGKFRIGAFLPVRLGRYVQIHDSLYVERSEGDEGVLAFQRADGTVCAGTANDLASLLATESLEQSFARFFAVEALDLVGDKQRLRICRREASQLFADRRIAANWVAREEERSFTGSQHDSHENLRRRLVRERFRDGLASIVQVSRTHFEDSRTKAVCLVSRPHRGPLGIRYWYGYFASSHRYLNDENNAFVILGCIGRNIGYALPAKMVDRRLEFLYKTKRTSGDYWHLELVERNGAMWLRLPRRHLDLKVDKYAFLLPPSGDDEASKVK